MSPSEASPQPNVLKAIAWMKAWAGTSAGLGVVALAGMVFAEKLNTSAILILPIASLFFMGSFFCARIKVELQAGKIELATLGNSFSWIALAGGCVVVSYLLLAAHACIRQKQVVEGCLAIAASVVPLALLLLCYRAQCSLLDAIQTLADPSKTFGFPLVEAFQTESSQQEMEKRPVSTA